MFVATAFARLVGNAAPTASNISHGVQITHRGQLQVETPGNRVLGVRLLKYTRSWGVAGLIAGAVGLSLIGGCGVSGKCAAAMLAGFISYQVWAAETDHVSSPATEALVAETTGTCLQAICERDGGYGPVEAEAIKGLSRATRDWLNKAILKFGRMEDTPADRRVLRLWLAEEMKKADMRDKDAVNLIPIVVEFMFIPGAEELMAQSIREALGTKLLKRLVPNGGR